MMMMMMMMLPSPSNSTAGHAAYHIAVITCTNYGLTDVLKNAFLIYVYISLRRNKILINIFHYLARLSLGLQPR
jgi:hypothetical protein